MFISNLRKKGLYFLVTLLMCSILISKTTIAQVTNGFPNPSSCNSSDIQLVSATLSGEENNCSNCTPGKQIKRTLSLSINNKSGSTRTAFAFWGNLEIYDGNTGTLKSTTAIKGCDGPVLRNSINTINFQNITYSCGDIVKITNLFIAWTDGSPGSTCDKIISANIAPKCGVLPCITVNAGVNADLIVTNLECYGNNNGAIDLTPIGGTAPYTYSWTASNGGVVPAGQANIQDLNGLVAGTYTVKITDKNKCFSTKTRSITGPGSALALSSCTSTNISCNGADGTASAGSVNNAVGVIQYSWKNAANTIIGTTANINNLSAGTYTLAVTDNCFVKTCDITLIGSTPVGTPVATITQQPNCTSTS